MGPETAQRIRVRCTTIGVLLLLLGPVATVAALLLGGRLPTAEHPIHDLGMVLVVMAAALPLIVGISALGARRYVSAQHVDVAGGRLVARGMLAMAIYCVVCAGLASAVLLLTADTVERTDSAHGAVAVVGAYLLLPASCGVIALVGAVLTRSALRPPAPPVPRGTQWR